MKKLLLISLSLLVLGSYSGCGNDGVGGVGGASGARQAGGAGGAGGAGQASVAASPSKGFYVKEGGSGKKDGTSWTNAFGDLQSAIDAAKDHKTKKQVYVAQGTYKPNDKDPTNMAKTQHFALKSDVEVIGGYPGSQDNEPNDINPALTILSGDLAGDDINNDINANKDDNVNNVFKHGDDDDLLPSAKLTGVTITKGNSDSTGGGMQNTESSPTLTNIIFSYNKAGSRGGGIYNADSIPILDNVTFSYNKANKTGGGIYNGGGRARGKIQVKNSKFNNNEAPKGGGIYNSNHNPELTNVTFTSNIATTEGGGIYNEGSNPKLTNVTFTSNTATTSGGGMYNKGSSTALNVTGGRFASNVATKHGGGMYNEGSSPTLTSVTFEDNTAKENGGGMYIDNASTPKLITCTFSNNKAENKDTGVKGKGGAIFSADTTKQDKIDKVTDEETYNTFTLVGENPNGYNNGIHPYNPLVDIHGFHVKATPIVDKPDGLTWATAFNDLQAAIEAAAAADSTIKKVYVAEGTYTPKSKPNPTTNELAFHFSLRNGVEVIGGYSGQGDQRSTKKTILSGDIGNEGVDADNAYHVFYHPSSVSLDATAKLSNVTITKGNARAVSGVNASGGGMYNEGSSPKLTNVTFESNRANENGGGMYNKGSSPKLTSVTFTHNAASANGGGIANYNDSNPEITGRGNSDNPDFKENTARYNGGGMYNENSSPSLTSVVFYTNQASLGGGMYILGKGTQPIVMKSSLFQENKAIKQLNIDYTIISDKEQGGGLYMKNTELELDIVNFTSNVAKEGGGIYATSDKPTVKNIIIDDATFVANKAHRGGGLYAQAVDITLDNIRIQNNQADKQDSYTIDSKKELNGGGIYTKNTILTLSNATSIVKNEARHHGGGMYNEESTIKTSSPNKPILINDNQAHGANLNNNNEANGSGGGMFNKDCSGDYNITLNNVGFYRNRSNQWFHGGGGAMFNDNSTVVLTNIVFADNRTQYHGGGIYNRNRSILTFNEGCKFIRNIANTAADGTKSRAGKGGAIYSTGGSQINNREKVEFGTITSGKDKDINYRLRYNPNSPSNIVEE